MQKNNSLLTILCILSMALLLILQGYWISNYYGLTRKNFEREVNMAFEDALKKEFSNRADTIQELLRHQLMDTSLFTISTTFDNKAKKVIYGIHSTKNPKDKYSSSFSLSDMDVMINPLNKKLVTESIAERFAKMLRNEDLENHIVYYRTQMLGKYMVELTDKIEFDTSKLRPVLNRYLAERNIFIPYSFYTKKEDSTTNKSTFDPALLRKYPIITRSLPTYRHSPGQDYVRVTFKDPAPYIISNIWVVLTSSIILVALVAFCLNLLLKSLQREKKLSHIKNDFISNITHEFKTPIATAMIAVEALNDKAVLNDAEKSGRYLRYAKNELSRISSLTDKILKLSLYDTGNYEIKKELINVDHVINELISVHELSEKKVNISFANNTAISEIMADKTQFQHAISNIMENAIKYGNDPVHITITCFSEGGFFVVSVKDNGPGIKPDDIPFVFEKFYRVKQNHHKQVKGYGLGLNYVKQIMEQHTGFYKLASNADGTELRLGWPI